jgi:hypothetical protein
MWFIGAVVFVVGVLFCIEHMIRRGVRDGTQLVLSELSELKKELSVIVRAIDPEQLADKIEARRREMDEARRAASLKIEQVFASGQQSQTAAEELTTQERLAERVEATVRAIATHAGIDEAELKRRKDLRELVLMEELADRIQARIRILRDGGQAPL